MNAKRVFTACILVLVAPLVAARSASSDAVVMDRMLALVRDTALGSPYAERQGRSLSRTGDPAARAQQAARDLRKLGLKARPQEEVLIAEWSGRSLPDEVVLMAAPLDSGEVQALAAAMGVFETFIRLQLKARRTVRLVAVPGEQAESRMQWYRDRHRSSLARHRALVLTDGRSVSGLRVRAVREAFAQLNPLRAALRPVQLDTLESQPQLQAAAADTLAGLGIPVFQLHPAPEGAAADRADLRRQVAVLATLVWLLGEMPEPLVRPGR